MRRAGLVMALLLAAGPAGAQDATPEPLALRFSVSPQGPVWIGQRVTTPEARVAVRAPPPGAPADLIPSLADQNPCAQSRRPIDMMRQG
jgi:hypothetical protein